MSTNTNSAGGGIGVFGLTFIVLLTLKLLHKIELSWFWVTVPLWGGLSLVFAFLGFCLLMAIVTGQFSAWRRGRR